ncbi:hypothetical protein [Chryseobacterium aquaticum]|uniref:Holin n=1 Tax=Chryseobacterium aquaticum subsp. greenlandense TaxID=345663 RepID=A0A101CHQ5_9FLAO|nr:hypothetical protein [Chryseobacterium aquaticum]KUJ56457.1 hypothetical protein AR686_07800 [Chryseobacterium aquaticum subsp. greenlandense]
MENISTYIMIKQFVVKNLLAIHYGGVGSKIWSSFQLAAIPAIGLTISERLTGWYIDSQTFIQIMIGLLFVDLILGIWKHWKASTFSFKNMILGFMKKTSLFIFFYFISEALIQILSDADLDGVYVKLPLKLIMFIYLGGNALVNMGIISNGKIPPEILLKRIAKFNKTLNINDLNLKEDETNNNSDNSQ